MSKRNKEQSFGIWLNEPYLFDHGKLAAAASDLARSGFGIIRVFLRRTNFTHRSPAAVEAVRTIVNAAHAEGARVVLDCEPHAEPVATEMGRLHPDGVAAFLVRVETRLIDGKFVLHVPAPDEAGYPSAFRGVEAAFLFGEDGAVRRIEDFRFDLRWEDEAYDTGFSYKEYAHVEGWPGLRRFHAHLRGRVDGGNRDRLVVYARFTNRKKVDFWAPGCWAYYDALLECYRGIPLDGVGWDEPAVTTGGWNCYVYGDGYAAAFERLNGYSLASRLYHLDEPGESPDSIKVRLDYYRTLNEGLFEAQRRLIAKATELFGPDLLLGTHHTWHGESMHTDYRAGAIDYFRLGDQMDAGYTDGWWWDDRSMAYAYTLASSLARLSPSGEAEANTWDMKPTNSLTEYYVRVMTLLDINWFNIWYGEAADTCLYPSHYTWPTAVREAARHRSHQLLLKGAKPVTEIAIVHGWEGVCGTNRAEIAAAHKGFCLNIATLLVDRSVAFDWIDPRLLAESTIDGDALVNRLGRYRVLVVPYANVLPRAAWDACARFARAGGKVVFVGPPPTFDTDGGALDDAFAELLDAAPLGANQYLAGIDRQCTLPCHRTHGLDVCYPLDGPADRLLVSIEGEPHGLRSPAGNVVYLSNLNPTGCLLDLTEPWLSPEVECHSDTILWRLYRRDNMQFLVVIARKDRSLRGIVRFAGAELEFFGGVVAVVEAVDDHLTVHGDNVAWRRVGACHAREHAPK